MRFRRDSSPVLIVVIAVLASLLAWPRTAPAADSPAATPAEILARTRRTGWEIAEVVINKLASGPADDFPGIQAWVQNYRELTRDFDPQTPLELWPTLDASQLLTHNPLFWRAYFDIAPGDAGLVALHSGLLLASGEFSRALYVLTIARQLPNVPDDVRQSLDALAVYSQKARTDLQGGMQEGIKLFDARNYAGAERVYRRQLALWPQDGWAAYETGLALHFRQELAAGRKPPALGSVQINSSFPTSDEVAGWYARAREHDPFQFSAYQGSDPDTVRISLAMFKECRPLWKQLAGEDTNLDRQVLERFSEACQQAGIDELAVVARWVAVARRGRYSPADHPLLSSSLRSLAPGPATEATLKRLAEPGPLKFKRLVMSERSKAAAGK